MISGVDREQQESREMLRGAFQMFLKVMVGFTEELPSSFKRALAETGIFPLLSLPILLRLLTD